MKVIDAHIHPFLDAENNIAAYGAPNTPEELFAELRRAGISKACGSVIRKTEAATFDAIVKLNDDALKIRDRYPDFYIPGALVHGGFPAESCRELERLFARGVRWIGELVPYVMKTGAYDSPGMMEIYALARDLGMPVNLHLWPSTLGELEVAAKNFPNLKLVIAHPGDFGEAPERFRFVAEHDNVFLDLSGTGLFRWNMLRYAIGVCGSEKLLFGSDFPICSAGMNLQGVLAETLSEEEAANVLFRNFERITGSN